MSTWPLQGVKQPRDPCRSPRFSWPDATSRVHSHGTLTAVVERWLTDAPKRRDRGGSCAMLPTCPARAAQAHDTRIPA